MGNYNFFSLHDKSCFLSKAKSIYDPGHLIHVLLVFATIDSPHVSCFATCRPEAHVIKDITSTVWKSLNRELLHVEKNLVGMDRRRASSSTSTSTSTCIGPWEYEVFLSFRGQDTRQNFTDHLYAALYQKGIRTFRMDHTKGEMILPTTLRAIEMSRCFLVILSKNYAHSKWCLDELKEIMESRRQMGKIVFPVFYHVNPSDVRNQGESYGEALANHERKIPLENTQRMRAALREVGNLSGWHIQNG